MGNIQSLATSAIILQALIAVLKLEEEELGEFLDPTRSEGVEESMFQSSCYS